MIKIITKKTISRECWNLDYHLMEWLNEHLKVYKKEANKVVNLEYYKFNFKGKEYTQLQIIDTLIEKTNYLLDDVDYFTENAKMNKTKNDIYDLMKLIHWHLWW